MFIAALALLSLPAMGFAQIGGSGGAVSADTVNNVDEPSMDSGTSQDKQSQEKTDNN